MSVKRDSVLETLMPSEWRIHITRREDDRYEIDYTEILEKPADMSEEEFQRAYDNTLKIVRPIIDALGIEVSVKEEGDKPAITIKAIKPLEEVASAIIAEFMMVSRIGNMTFRELFILTELARVAEKVKEGSITPRPITPTAVPEFNLSMEQVGRLLNMGVRAEKAPFTPAGDTVAVYFLIPTRKGDWIRKIPDSKWEGSYIPLFVYRQGVASILVPYGMESTWQTFADRLSKALGMKIIVRGD